MKVVNSLIDDGHIDAFTFGHIPDIAQIDILTWHTTTLASIAQMPLTAMQMIVDSQLPRRALPQKSCVSVIVPHQHQKRALNSRI
ncbi:MAG: hypothetical protein OXE79_01550 [Acidimicrobiaceae bacterium]|nr:hypothetical protein [Acidimicrobiaceae bacterium]MCY4294409.1 hypothetical protein [Acidimicrobiaceae bacterium]